MKHKIDQFGYGRAILIPAAALGIAIAGSAAVRMTAFESLQTPTEDQRSVSAGNKFFCNTKALAPAARAHHKQLTEKLIGSRTEIVETEKGYEFQYNPSVVSIAELADWVVAESKCCPFFDFHIDLEREGTLVCLRLTGDQGIKHFIQSEFQLPPK
jgi:hypothetical protein